MPMSALEIPDQLRSRNGGAEVPPAVRIEHVVADVLGPAEMPSWPRIVVIWSRPAMPFSRSNTRHTSRVSCSLRNCVGVGSAGLVQR